MRTIVPISSKYVPPRALGARCLSPGGAQRKAIHTFCVAGFTARTFGSSFGALDLGNVAGIARVPELGCRGRPQTVLGLVLITHDNDLEQISANLLEALLNFETHIRYLMTPLALMVKIKSASH